MDEKEQALRKEGDETCNTPLIVSAPNAPIAQQRSSNAGEETNPAALIESLQQQLASAKGEVEGWKSSFADKDAQLQAVKVTCDTLRAQLSASNTKVDSLKARNILNAMKNTCGDCGHNKTEDGCPHCQSKRILGLEAAIEVKDKALTQLKKERPASVEWTTGQVMIDFALNTKEVQP